MWAARPHSKLESGNWRSKNEQILQNYQQNRQPNFG
jgi:hypothetical protein